MKEINIAKTIVLKRRERGITQDEVASYIGVSKASVSKWETGQSYPDITLLPMLAAYFNCTIDDLLGYSPQMTKEEIKKTYQKLSKEFATKPFEDVYEECDKIIKKYYSCFPLLLQMAILLINHFTLISKKERQLEIVQEAIDLCIRVKMESEEVWLSKEAASMEATCYLMIGNPQQILELLGEEIRPLSNDIEMIAQAYQLMGNHKQAKKVSQIAIYQHFMHFIGITPSYLILNSDNILKINEILYRILEVAKLFELKKLNPNSLAQIYLTAAHVYCLNQEKQKALEMLEEYADLCVCNFFPYTLHGDSYFDTIEEWFQTFQLGMDAPRDEKIIRESMLQAVEGNPGFSYLSKEPRFLIVLEKLKANLGGKS